MRILPFIFVVPAIVLAACATPDSARPVAAGETRKEGKPVDEKNVDSAKFAKAPVVLRARRISQGSGSKYLWCKVEILRVLKNESGQQFDKTLEVAYYSWDPGVPDGESTLYLEPYNESPSHPWKLLGGSAAEGVSHSSASK
jgi:hypothetical protein